MSSVIHSENNKERFSICVLRIDKHRGTASVGTKCVAPIQKYKLIKHFYLYVFWVTSGKVIKFQAKRMTFRVFFTAVKCQKESILIFLI